MANRRERPVFTSVPQFGGWEQNAGGAGPTNYSVVFTQARANRKEVKKDIKRSSIGREEELAGRNHQDHQDDSVTRRRRLLTYFNCCIKA